MGRPAGEEVMVYKLSSDDGLILCSSARCVRKLLGQGWCLADPSQTEDLMQALKAEEATVQGEAVQGLD